MSFAIFVLGWISLALAESLDTVTIVVNQKPITVEIADEPHERARGLMFREEIPKNGGMLFVYKEESIRSFWMKNTYIPLSIAYVDKSGKIIHIANMNPRDETSVPSIYPAKYALEMNQGWFEKHQVTVGMKIERLP